jgi:hypothetical protein
VFEGVDVNVLVETTVDGGRMGVPHVVRTASERSGGSTARKLGPHRTLRTRQNSRGGAK